jgi:hypothetical protein
MAPLNTDTTTSRNAAIENNSYANDWESLLTLSQATHSRKCALCYQFLQLVEAHFREQHAVAFYARQLHVCPDYLLQCCK